MLGWEDSFLLVVGSFCIKLFSFGFLMLSKSLRIISGYSWRLFSFWFCKNTGYVTKSKLSVLNSNYSSYLVTIFYRWLLSSLYSSLLPIKKLFSLTKGMKDMLLLLKICSSSLSSPIRFYFDFWKLCNDIFLRGWKFYYLVLID